MINFLEIKCGNWGSQHIVVLSREKVPLNGANAFGFGERDTAFPVTIVTDKEFGAVPIGPIDHVVQPLGRPILSRYIFKFDEIG